MTDTRRLSPQTISSSGYHSDLSSTHESPESIHENVSIRIDRNASYRIQIKTIDDKPLRNKNLSRVSSFLRKQYERAKSKLLVGKSSPRSIQTCSKATSTSPLSYPTDVSPSKPQPTLHVQPVQSVYVRPVYDNTLKQVPSRTYASINECYSQQPSHRLLSYSNPTNSQFHSQSFRRPTTNMNSENSTTGCSLSTNTNVVRRRQYYTSRPNYNQNYYPYKYINKNYDYHQLVYTPLSDFISTIDSAFKPIKAYQHSSYHRSEQIPLSDDPCDLEVAQYFHQIPQWSNSNYFDIYSKETRKNYTETLC